MKKQLLPSLIALTVLCGMFLITPTRHASADGDICASVTDVSVAECDALVAI